MPGSHYPLHRPELRDALSRGEAAIREAMGPSKRYRDGDALIRTAEDSVTIYLLETGWAARTRLTEDGQRQVIGVCLPGDLIGIKSILLERQLDTIECLVPVTVCGIDHRQLLELSGQDQAVSLRVMFQLAEDERRSLNWIAALGKGNAEARIATLLLDLRGRLLQAGLISGNDFHMPLTQQEIADHLGLTVVHVNRILRRLREAGIVTVQRGQVSIKEMPRLARMAAPMQDIYERATPEFGGSA